MLGAAKLQEQVSERERESQREREYIRASTKKVPPPPLVSLYQVFHKDLTPPLGGEPVVQEYSGT